MSPDDVCRDILDILREMIIEFIDSYIDTIFKFIHLSGRNPKRDKKGTTLQVGTNRLVTP